MIVLVPVHFHETDTLQAGLTFAFENTIVTSHKQFSFSHRVINNWNELPDSVVLSDNLNIFKRNLDLFWKDKDFKYEEK